MLTLRRRAAQASRQAARVARREKEAEDRDALRKLFEDQGKYIKETNQLRKDSRRETKEDILMGAIAPVRASTAREIELIGGISQRRFQLEPGCRKVPRTEWNITKGDRVVVLKGKDRHKIGVVKRSDPENSVIIVEGLNMAPMIVPEYYQKVYPDQKATVYTEMPLHYDEVRLVVPLLNEATGKMEDTIVGDTDSVGFWTNPYSRKLTWLRVVRGTRTVIPWPKNKKEDKKDEVADTKIKDLETVTYVRTLLTSPLPEGLIDELRNKFSKFRTRHDDEYVEAMEAKEKDERDLKELSKSQIPGYQANAEPVPPPSADNIPEDVLIAIGRVMAANKPGLLEQIVAKREAGLVAARAEERAVA